MDEETGILNNVRNNVWTRRTTKQRTAIIIGFTIVTGVLVFGTAILASSKTRKCKTEMCVSESARILANLDTSINPCDDFYQFTCGGYIANHTLPDDKGSYGNFYAAVDVLTQRLTSLYDAPAPEKEAKAITFVRNTYKGCIDNETLDEAGLEPLKQTLSELGGWPIAGIPAPNGTYETLNEMIKLIGLQGNPLISVSVNPNAYDTSKYAITPSFGIGRTDLLTSKTDEKAEKLVEAYKKFIISVIRLFITDPSSNDTFGRNVDELVEFETKLANLTTAPEDRRDQFAITKNMTFDELNSLIPGIPWFKFFQRLYKVVAPKVNLTSDMEIIVYDLPYLQGLSVLLMDNSSIPEVIANYLGWRYVQANGYLTTSEFRAKEFEFHRVRDGVKEPSKMSERCINNLANLNILPFVVGRSYVDTYFTEKSKLAAEEIIQKVLEQYSIAIKSADWMDEETRGRSLDKIKTLKRQTGYPKWIKNDEELDRIYNFGVSADPKKAFDSMKRIHQVLTRNMFGKLLHAVDDEHEWPMGPAIVNAAYEASQNSITIPAGILQLVFFNESRPAYLNYGAIGQVIGHEIGHGFDDAGSQYDSMGNLKNWWSDKSKEGFNKKADCFANQYSAITDPTVNISLNGRATLGENIADNGGIHLAFEAYKSMRSKDYGPLPGLEKYSTEQLFFISYGNIWCGLIREEVLRSQILYDAHSPAKYRINVPVSNLDSFRKTFKCNKGDKMRPDEQCTLW